MATLANFPPISPLTSILPIPQPNLPSKFKSSLKSYSQIITLDEIQQTHAYFLKTHFQNLHQNQHSSLQLHSTPVARYNFLITSYNKNDQPVYALTIYAQMRAMDIDIDSFVVSSVLKSCAQIGWKLVGREIHGFAVKNGLGCDVFVGNTLIQMYSECGFVGTARLVFDRMEGKDAVSWSTMIRSYGQYRMFPDALEIIREMQYDLVKPSESALISMVNLLADAGILQLADLMLGYVIKASNWEHTGANLITSLVDMYAKCGKLARARRLFDTLVEKGIASYTAMVAGYIRWNALEEGLSLFAQMTAAGIFPNEVTLLSMISECGKVEALDMGKQLHSYVLRKGFNMTVALGTSLVDMYGKCREIAGARAIFESMERKDVKTWTALISAYAQDNCIGEATDLLSQMKGNGIRPNQVTMVNLVSVCADSSALETGKWIHAYIDKERIQVDVILTTALIDMYAKCGDIAAAYKLFDEATSRDVGMWNAMIMGFGMHGFVEDALELFADMEKLRIQPNDLTFIGLLNACSHAGMVTEGMSFFQNMPGKYALVPKIEHYGCVVDLLGRAGLIQDAYEMIQSMPMRPNAVVWGALLAACKVHGNPNLGEIAGRELLQIEPESCGHNILMSNMYATAERWTDVAGIRTAMKKRGMMKEPGVSCIEVNGDIHEFKTGHQEHPQREEIHVMLEEMINKLKGVGYKPDTSVVLLNIERKEKEESLRLHSEKIAMAFSLINTAPGTPIRIVKNLRVCDDCHTATKLLSKIYGRVITVRDRSRFHHFRDGSCSCGDYW